jgi:hypothetical protein
MNCFCDASTRSVCARYQDAVMHGAVLTGSTWSLHALCTLGRSLCVCMYVCMYVCTQDALVVLLPVCVLLCFCMERNVWATSSQTATFHKHTML